MLRLLIAKDLRRAWRNPVAFAIHLAVPIVITALIGLAFGPSARSGGLGRIKLGIVDEDNSPVSQFLRGMVNQGQASKHLEPVFLPRDDALRQINENQLSAVVVLPKSFAQDYLAGRRTVTIELIKNPAQSFHPAIVEELLQALTTALNALDRSLRPELREWQALFDRSERPAPREVADLVARTGDRFEAARDYLYPPLITYAKVEEKVADAAGPAQPTSGKRAASPVFSIFAFILPGMAAMFLLLMADNALRDLYREQRFRTFQRFRTLRHELFTFVGAKVAFAIVILLIGSLILFGGGAILFGIQWGRPVPLALLILAYAVFASGFMALVTALAGTEKRADTLNTLAAMGLSLAAGCMFPREQLPAFISQQLTPWMPPHWFAAAVRALQTDGGGASWIGNAMLLLSLGLGLVAVAAWIFQRRLWKGARS